jgi:uncharacterized protein (DUF2267 family)
MSQSGIAAIDRAVQTAQGWLADVAHEFETEDRAFVYRVVRGWLHAVRDRLPVVDAAHLGAQLPELLRGVYYEGWEPNKVPIKYDRAEYVSRLAAESRISEQDVPKATRAVSTAFDRHLSGHLAGVLDHFPADLRDMLRPAPKPGG